MATPTLTHHRISGALGDLLVDVRAGGRDTPRPAVVIVHGFKGFKDWGMFPPFAERIARAGFTAVNFNLSGSGVDERGEFVYPERFGHNTYSAELSDVAAIVAELTAGNLGVAPPAGIGLLGHSRGGGAAVLYTPSEPNIEALVTWSAIGSTMRWTPDVIEEWRARGHTDVVNSRTGQVLPLYTDILDDLTQHAERLDLDAAARRVSCPWLIIHGEADESVPVEDAHHLMNASGRPTTELLLIKGAGHTFGAVHPWQGSTPALDQVFDATLRFFAAHLG
ncbi:MAG TPA: alpha/beta fold hydrolase [Gemmatimonadales bacterium]|nr:alpha/beta fold hydrolase [Gemmatimonadales bacterium]